MRQTLPKAGAELLKLHPAVSSCLAASSACARAMAVLVLGQQEKCPLSVTVQEDALADTVAATVLK